MSVRKRASIWIFILLIFLSLISWHVVDWYARGIYLEMLVWVGSGRGYLSALYHIGLIVVSGVTLGILARKISDLIGYK